MPHTQQFLSQNAASPESASQLISGEEEVKLWGSWVAWEQAWKGFLQILNILHTIPTTGMKMRTEIMTCWQWDREFEGRSKFSLFVETPMELLEFKWSPS